MKSFVSVLIGALTFALTGLYAQEVQFGKITEEELLEASYEKDPSAPAAVLYRGVSTNFQYAPSDGFHVITIVHERIKIFREEGFEYATVREKLYKYKGEKKNLGNLRGYTYNLDNGEIVRTKIKGSQTFSKSLNKFYDEESFTMPNVRAGSVIEYEYRLDSPFSYAIDEIILQYDIPIERQEISVAIPEYYHFNPIMKGYLQVQPEYSSDTGLINYVSKSANSGTIVNTRYRSGTATFRESKTTLRMKDVPALKEEPFVNDMDNYRSAVNYELQYVQFPQSAREDFAGSWEKVIKTIYDSDGFGRQLAHGKYFGEDLTAMITDIVGDKEKAAAVFRYVQQRMHWNGYTGYIADKGVREAYEDKTGNVADINLMLVAMLKAAGLRAHPVLISTRDNGVPLFPTVEGFNYVIAAIELEGDLHFLDATNKYTEPDMLPVRALNWFGTLVNEDGTHQMVSVLPVQLSKEIHMSNVNLSADGAITGKVRKTYTDYSAYTFRNENNTLSEEAYLEKLMNAGGGMEISAYDIKSKNEVGQAVVETFEFSGEGLAPAVGENLYISPLFNHAITENPFKTEARNFPIDFSYPRQEKIIMNIRIPEGYQVSSKPEDLSLSLAEDMASFTYKLEETGNNVLQLLVDLKINHAVIPAAHYASVKELYKNIVEKETEKVVLSKIRKDEHTERAAGGG